MMKKLNFVFDKKSGDILAPAIVPNHVVAIRNYTSMVNNKDLLFVKYPEDFELITVEIAFEDGCFGIGSEAISVTSFTEIVGDVNGE